MTQTGQQCMVAYHDPDRTAMHGCLPCCVVQLFSHPKYGGILDGGLMVFMVVSGQE